MRWLRGRLWPGLSGTRHRPQTPGGQPPTAGVERGGRLALGGPGVLHTFCGQRSPISLGLGLRPALARGPMATPCPPRPLPALSPDRAGGRRSRAAARLRPCWEVGGPLLLPCPTPPSARSVETLSAAAPPTPDRRQGRAVRVPRGAEGGWREGHRSKAGRSEACGQQVMEIYQHWPRRATDVPPDGAADSAG